MRVSLWLLGIAGLTVCFAFYGRITACMDLQQGLQHAFNRFSAACGQAGTKISTKRLSIGLSRPPRQCIPQVSGNTLQRMETFKYLKVVFMSDGNRNKEIDTRLVKQTQFCVSFITAKHSVFNRSLFRSSPVVMNLRWRLKEYCQKNKQQRWEICEEFSV